MGAGGDGRAAAGEGRAAVPLWGQGADTGWERGTGLALGLCDTGTELGWHRGFVWHGDRCVCTCVCDRGTGMAWHCVWACDIRTALAWHRLDGAGVYMGMGLGWHFACV